MGMADELAKLLKGKATKKLYGGDEGDLEPGGVRTQTALEDALFETYSTEDTAALLNAHQRRRRIIRRWQTLFFLHANPSLRNMRARKLACDGVQGVEGEHILEAEVQKDLDYIQSKAPSYAARAMSAARSVSRKMISSD